MFKLPDGRIERLRLNKKLMFLVQLFLEIKSLNAVIQLFYLNRGIGVSEIVFLSLVWSLTVLVFDVPSSYLADLIGRKKCLMISILLTSGSVVMMYFAYGFSYFIILYVIMAAGYAFFQGTDEALLYDSLREVGEEKSVQRITGKYFSSQYLAKIFVPFLGAIIARNLSSFEFNILISIDLVGTFIAFFVATLVMEPNRFVDASKLRLGIFKDSFKIIFSNKTLFKLSLNRILVFEGAYLYWRVYQVVLSKAGLTVFLLGVIYFVMQSLLFSSLWFADKIQKRIGEINYIWIPQVVGVFALGLSLISENKWVLFISAVPLLLLGTLRDPIFASQIHVRIPSFNRATVVSALSIIKGFLDIPVLLLAGYLAKFDVKYVWVTGFAILILAMVLSPIYKKDIISVESN